MRVYLVRHGHARSKSEDPDRHLSDRGLAEVRRVAEYLRPQALRVGAIWHSTKTRARETAEILATVIAADEGLVERGDLAPRDRIDPLYRAVEQAQADLVIVGHLPFLGLLASRLVTGRELEGTLAFATGGTACLERDADGRWRVAWTILPDLLPDADG